MSKQLSEYPPFIIHPLPQGIVEAAAYVHRRLKEEDLLGRAFNLTKVTLHLNLPPKIKKII